MKYIELAPVGCPCSISVILKYWNILKYWIISKLLKYIEILNYFNNLSIILKNLELAPVDCPYSISIISKYWSIMKYLIISILLKSLEILNDFNNIETLNCIEILNYSNKISILLEYWITPIIWNYFNIIEILNYIASFQYYWNNTNFNNIELYWTIISIFQ